jgi:hypothetical protein
VPATLQIHGSDFLMTVWVTFARKRRRKISGLHRLRYANTALEAVTHRDSMIMFGADIGSHCKSFKIRTSLELQVRLPSKENTIAELRPFVDSGMQIQILMLFRTAIAGGGGNIGQRWKLFMIRESLGNAHAAILPRVLVRHCGALTASVLSNADSGTGRKNDEGSGPESMTILAAQEGNGT